MAMEPQSADWRQFVAWDSPDTAPKKRRSAVVCVACHLRKVKCDLKTRLQQNLSDCSNCHSSQQSCEVRPSQRGKRQKTSTESTAPPAVPPVVAAPAAAAPAAAAAVAAQGEDAARTRRRTESEATAETILGALPTATSGLTEAPLQHILPPPGAAPAVQSFLPNIASSSTASAVTIGNSGNDVLAPGCSITELYGSAVTLDSSSTGKTSVVYPRSEGPGQSYNTGDVDTGYQNVYRVEHARLAEQEELTTNIDHYFKTHHNQIPEDLQESFIETYFEYCYAFCPVLDRQTLAKEMRESEFLSNAIALAASHIRPPLVAHDPPSVCYQRAKSAFYNDEESDGLTALKGLCLFYWWAPRAPSTVHRHSSWWWTSVIIRHAQQANFHREPPMGHYARDRLNLSLRRRIWWTAFARERLTSLCQSKPCIIDVSDCSVLEPQPSDFPDDPVSQKRGRIFLYWTRLCEIIGRVAKRLANPAGASVLDLHLSLVKWVKSLPDDLLLPIGSERTTVFDRDVHQLYLPYLTTIIVLNLRRSARDLPDALPPAIVAASCTARILRDVLARGNTRFLMAITCWYTGMAFIPLLQATRMTQLASEANESLNVLLSTGAELEKMWASAEIIRAGCERMRRESIANEGRGPSDTHVCQGLPSSDFENFDWPELFPFVTKSTNNTVACLLDDKASGSVTHRMPPPNDLDSYTTMQNQYNFFLDPFSGVDFNFDNMPPIDFGLPPTTF